METRIKWDEGEGYIVAVFDGNGEGLLALSSSVPNEGLDREHFVTVETTEGETKKTETITVSQPGLREIFETTDGFALSDGGTFNVLKENGLQ